MSFDNLPVGLLLSLALSCAIGAAAYWRGVLKLSGVLGLLAIGPAFVAGGGWSWFGVLIAFLVSSSVLTLYRSADKQFMAGITAKTGGRDIVQAAANAGVGVLLAIANLICPARTVLVAFLGAMATVNADTWATEVGVLSKSQPKLITNGRPVAKGTSGAVSLVGSIAAIAGAASIGAVGATLSAIEEKSLGCRPWFVVALVSSLAGIVGAFTDSVLGATVQARYYCCECKQYTESTKHSCGSFTTKVGGWRFVTNDLVNFVASASGAISGAVFFRLAGSVGAWQ